MTKAVVIEFHAKGEVETIRKEEGLSLEVATRYAREYLENFLNHDLEDHEEEDEFEVVSREQDDGSIRVGFINGDGDMDAVYFIEVKEVSVQ